MSVFQSIPTAPGHRWRLERRSTGNSKALPYYWVSSSPLWSATVWSTADDAPNLMSILLSTFPPPVNKTQIYSILLGAGAHHPTAGGKSTIYLHRIMASNLEGLTPILTGLHLTANCPSACWKWLTKAAIQTASSAKSRDAILRFPNQSLSSTHLHLGLGRRALTLGKQT